MDSEVLLVDASNAFNSLNRHVALLNMFHLCPPLATTLTNTYCNASALYIDDNTLWSHEGTTQGDPLAMLVYPNSGGIVFHKVFYKCKNEHLEHAQYAFAGTGIQVTYLVTPTLMLLLALYSLCRNTQHTV